MPDLLQYLLKLSVSISVVYLFYRLVLRKLTFYAWNRWYLLGYSLLSFLIPFINISFVLERNRLMDNNVVQFVPEIINAPAHGVMTITGVEVSHPAKLNWMVIIFVTGAIIMLLRLLIQYYAYCRIRRSSQLLTHDMVKVYQVDKNIIPFSFGNSIFINRHLHATDELQEIMRHEFVHVKQKHTVDIIWGELLCIINWYNPFAWLIRGAMRQNLEFIADHKVIENGMDKKKYQYLLLKVIGFRGFSIAGQFNSSSLKKRIAMMNKMKSAKTHLIKFFFTLPLLAVLILACRNKIDEVTQQRKKNVSVVPDKSPRMKTDIQYIAGIVYEAGSYKPVNKFSFRILVNKKLVKVLETDENGFYYYAVDFKSYGGRVNYEVDYAQPGYEKGREGEFVKDSTDMGYFRINIVAPLATTARQGVLWVELPMKEIINAADKEQVVYRLLTEHSPQAIAGFILEENLKEGFLKAFPKTENYITEYKGQYYWKNGVLVGDGDTSHIKLYINERRVSYSQLATYNEVKRLTRPAVWVNGNNLSYYFFTYAAYKTPAPAALWSVRNVERKKAEDMNSINFGKEAVIVNGERLPPDGTYHDPTELAAGKIKNIFLLKNELASYYDEGATQIWWLETIAPSPVMRRPAIAK